MTSPFSLPCGGGGLVEVNLFWTRVVNNFRGILGAGRSAVSTADGWERVGSELRVL